MKTVLGALIVAFTSTSGWAHAQETSVEEGAADDASAEGASVDEAPVDEAPADEAPKGEKGAGQELEGASSKDGADGTRFRFGVAGGAGPMMVAGYGFTYFGVDLRFGAQINDAIGVYAQPQIGYYQLNGTGSEVLPGGLLGGSFVVDYTLFDRMFLGAGLGYAILNVPAGLELHFRAGGYPLMGRSKEKVRRKGLMLGADLRLHFVEGLTVVAPTFNLGYEAF